MIKSNRLCIIFVSCLPYDFALDYLRALAEGLSQKNTVIFTSPFNKRYLKIKDIILDHKTRVLFLHYLKGLCSNFLPFFTIQFIPLDRFAVIRALNERLNKILLQGVIKMKSSLLPRVAYLTYPFDLKTIDLYNASCLVYDCMDYPGSTISKSDNKTIKKNHNLILRSADITFVNTNTFYNMNKNLTNPVKIPNGYILNPYILARKSPIPDDLKKIDKPKIGFVGYTYAKLDFNLLIKLFKLNPDKAFIFIGPIVKPNIYSNTPKKNIKTFNKNIIKVFQHPNVYHFPYMNRTNIIRYVQHLDVCIIPYDTKQKPVPYGNPIKAYEYLASGKQIVSTSIKTLVEIQDYIEFASNAETFTHKINMCLSHKQTQREIHKRVLIAQAHDTTNKVMHVNRSLAKLIFSK